VKAINQKRMESRKRQLARRLADLSDAEDLVAADNAQGQSAP
jgi:hypothetical protein